MLKTEAKVIFFCLLNLKFIILSLILTLKSTMNKKLALSLIAIVACLSSYAQLSPETIAKRERHKNLVVKEWNQDAKGKNGWLDHVTTYDDQGRKIEEIEYATYGQSQRTVSFYEDDKVGKVTKEVVYDSRNKVTRIRLFEYNPDGTRKTQYNYLPNGKLYSKKQYEYKFVTPGTEQK